MERNHICKKCGGIAGWDPYFQSWICTRCGNMEPKPITNADRIRAMTDEELAMWINDVTTNALSVLYLGSDKQTKNIFYWLDWLRQETVE